MNTFPSFSSEDAGFLERLMHWRRRVSKRRRAARELQMLNALNDYVLNDIGLRRERGGRLRRD